MHVHDDCVHLKKKHIVIHWNKEVCKVVESAKPMLFVATFQEEIVIANILF